jgi:hypothetical protein
MEAVRSFDNPLARASENHLGVLYRARKAIRFLPEGSIFRLPDVTPGFLLKGHLLRGGQRRATGLEW